jgi:hypothetical protein
LVAAAPFPNAAASSTTTFVVDDDVCADPDVFYVVVKVAAGAFSLQLLFGGRGGNLDATA